MAEVKIKRFSNKFQNYTIIFFIIVFVFSLLFYKPYFFEKNPRNLVNIGLYYLKKKDYEDASRTFAKIESIKPSEKNKYYLGYALLMSGDLEKGVKYLEEALKEDPKDRDVYLAIGDYHFIKKENERALKYYKKAYNLGPNSKVYFKLGVYYYEVHDTQNAYENLIKSLDLEPDNLDIYPYMAEVYTRKGLFISAFEAYEHYLNEKCKQGIPYTYLLSEEAEKTREKMRELRDMAGEM